MVFALWVCVWLVALGPGLSAGTEFLLFLCFPGPGIRAAANQRAMNSAISAMVFPDFLNKKRVFGAKIPAIIQKLSQHIVQKSLSGEGAGNRL